MPSRSKLESLVRDAGKALVSGDLKKTGKDGKAAPDFTLLLKLDTSKQKLSPDEMLPDAELFETDDAVEVDKDELAISPTPQAIFGQSLLTFERLLGQQQHDDGDDGTASKTAQMPKGADIDAGDGEEALALADMSSTSREPVDVNVLEKAKVQRALDAPATPLQTVSAPVPQELPAQPKSAPMPVALDTPAAATVSPELPKTMGDEKRVADQPATPNSSISASPPPVLPAIEPKLSASPALVAPVSSSRPVLTDVQIVSDRTNGAARTLVIQLQPIELGTVTARLRLNPDGMHIQITATDAVMAEHLAKDYEMLGKALRRAGVTDDASIVTISIVDRSAAAGNTQTGQQNVNGQEQADGRFNGQGQSGFQGTPQERPAGQQHFGDIAPDEHIEKLAKSDPQNNLLRGLIV